MFFSRTYVARRLEDVQIIISDGVIGCHWEVPAQQLLKDLGWEHEECDGLVYLWPMTRRDLPPLVLRLIVLQRGNRKIYLPTNVFDPRQLSDEEAGMLYEMRWGIEVFYRSYKQTLSRRRLLSRTPATCLAES
jgi:IS4 transposase